MNLINSLITFLILVIAIIGTLNLAMIIKILIEYKKGR